MQSELGGNVVRSSMSIECLGELGFEIMWRALIYPSLERQFILEIPVGESEPRNL
jgi:hypothetical protein